MRKTIATLIVFLAFFISGHAQNDPAPAFKSLSARLIFEVSPHNPQQLDVFLHLVNSGPSDVQWTANMIADLQAHLTDAAGKPAPPPGMDFADISSTSSPYTLPAGSRMDLRISINYGVSTTDPKSDEYRIQVGSGVWNIPKNRAGAYSLQIKLSGWSKILSDRMQSMPQYLSASKRVLLDLPPQGIVITTPPTD